MIRSFLDARPVYDESNFIAPSAELIGDVVLGRSSSIWFNTTIRADCNWIRIGRATNIQDNSVIHVTNRVSPTRIGDQVTVGHSAVIHGCTVEDRVLVGMGAIVLDDTIIGADSIIGARALVTQRTRIPPRSLVLGAPARVVRQLTDAEVADILRYADNYLKYSAIYRGVERPESNPFYDAPGPAEPGV